MKTISQFDYIIVGGGLSGLHLSYSFQNDNYFKNHKILVIDNFKSKKENNFFSFYVQFTCIFLLYRKKKIL